MVAAFGMSTFATHVVLMHRVSARTTADLVHERAEFGRVLAAFPQSSATEVLRLTIHRSVPEPTLVLVGTVNGRVVAASRNAADLGLLSGAPLLRQWSTVTTPTERSTITTAGPITYVSVPFRTARGPDHAVFVAAVLTAPERSEVWRITQITIVVEAVALTAAVGVSWWVAGRVLRPVRQTTELARRITENDLTERIPVSGNDEITALTVTINEMLDRLQSALSTQRAFLADAGHELRTPITIVQGNLETLRLTDADDIESATIALDELQRMSRMVDDLLTLARSERPDFLHRAGNDVGELVADLEAKLKQLDPGRWTVTAATSGACLLDRQRITEAVLELAANARTYSPPYTPLALAIETTRDGLEIRVTDHGPGIPIASRRRIFERFTRVDGRRATGTGLGLSIVDAICRAHGGTITVADASPPPGAEFRIWIPCRMPARDSTDISAVIP